MQPPDRMSAVRLHAFGGPVRIDTVPVPAPASGEVLIKVLAAAVTHLDCTVAGGAFDVRPELPHILGAEAVGEVVAFGASADARAHEALLRAWPGASRVLLDAGVGLDRAGAWASYVCAPVSAIRLVDDDADLLAVLAATSPSITADRALHHAGCLAPGEDVAIVGANGACGLAATHHALRDGFGEVYAVVRHPARLAGVPADAIGVIAGPGMDGAPARPVDLIVDTVGGPELERRLKWVRPGGRVVLVGYTAGTRLALDLPNLLASAVTLIPFNGMLYPPDQSPAGRAELPPVPYASVAFAKIPEAFAQLARGARSGRIIAELA